MTVYINLLLYILSLFFKGALILYLLNGDCKNVWKKPYLLFCFGSGITSLLLFLGALLRIPFRMQEHIILGMLVVFALAKKLLFKKPNKAWSINNTSLKNTPLASWQKPIRLICICIIAVQICFVFMHSLIVPEQSWDGRMRWGVKAEVLYTEQTVFTDYFKNSYYYVTHPNYPLLIPLQMTNLYTYVNGVNEHAVKILFSLYFLMIALALYDYLRSATSSFSAIVFTALLVTIPQLLINEGSATTMMADVPLALYVTIAVIFLLHYIQQRTVHLLVPMGLILFFCAFTKLEGFVYGCVLIASLFILCIKGKNTRYQFLTHDLPMLILSFVIPYIPWCIFRHTYIPYHYANYPQSVSISYILSKLHRIPYIIHRYINELFHISTWHVTWMLPIFGIANVYRMKSYKKEVLFLLFVLVGFFLFYSSSHIFSSWWNSQTDESFKEFIDVTLSRQLLHIAPVALIFASLSLKKYFDT